MRYIEKRKYRRRVKVWYMRLMIRVWERVYKWVEFRWARRRIDLDLYDHKGSIMRGGGETATYEPTEDVEEYRVCPECGCEYMGDGLVCASCMWWLDK